MYGVGPAIVAGDALQILAHQVLLESPSGRGPAASAALAEATAAMIAGQADDIAFETRRDVTVEQCTAMSAAKTGALLGCAASIGAVLAGAPAATVGALRDYGRHLGLAFQAVDDLLGIWGDPARTGKPAGSDLRQRKKSMPIVSALAAGGAEADELRALILGPPAGGVRPLTGTNGKGPHGPASTGRCLRSTPTRSSGPPTWSRPAAAASGPRCGPRPISTPPSGALERVRLSADPRRDLADIAVFVVERES